MFASNLPLLYKLLMQVPDNFKLVYPKSEIDLVSEKLAREISKDFLGKDVVIAPVLRGGVYFFCNLAPKIEILHLVSMFKAKSYVGTEQGDIKIEILDDSFIGKDVILVDDICDSGKTLSSLEAQLMEMGARSVTSVVLIQRMIENQIYQPKYVGFHYFGPEWFVGFGCDNEGFYSTLPDLYILNK